MGGREGVKERVRARGLSGWDTSIRTPSRTDIPMNILCLDCTSNRYQLYFEKNTFIEEQIMEEISAQEKKTRTIY